MLKCNTQPRDPNMSTTTRDTATIGQALRDTVLRFGGRKMALKSLLPFARCVEITLNNDRDVADTIPAVRFCAEVGIPVCFAHLGVPHTTETIAYAARRCMERRYHGTEAACSESIFDLAFSKINMWGEKYSAIGDVKILAQELLGTLDGQTVARLQKLERQTLVFLGDSLMAKLHWAAWGGYPDILAELFGLINPKVEVVNAGIGGQTSGQGLARVVRDVISRKPSRCFVAFGGNDLTCFREGQDPEGMVKFRENMTSIARICRQNSIRPVFLNGARQYVSDENLYRREVVETINAIGQREDVPVIDTHTLSWAGDPRDWLCCDNLHLNNAGQKKFAAAVVNFLGAEA